VFLPSTVNEFDPDVTQNGTITGGNWRPFLRRMGTTLGVLALLVQCLVFAFHRPAQAAPLSPFQDPAAWCFSIGGDNSTGPDQDTAPASHKTAMVCPLCQTLQAASAAVPSLGFALVEPSLQVVAVATPATSAPPSAPDRRTSSPRAPPTLI